MTTGKARQAGLGEERPDMTVPQLDERDGIWQCRRGTARRGRAGKAGIGNIWTGPARYSKAGKARRGTDGHHQTRSGLADIGKAGKARRDDTWLGAGTD